MKTFLPYFYDKQKEREEVAFELVSGKTDEAIWYLSNPVGARYIAKIKKKLLMKPLHYQRK